METLAKEKENQPDGVTVSSTVVFVTDSGGDEDKMKHIASDASTPNVFLLLFALPCLLHLYHCIDLVLQGEHSDEVLEYDRQDDTLLA